MNFCVIGQLSLWLYTYLYTYARVTIIIIHERMWLTAQCLSPEQKDVNVVVYSRIRQQYIIIKVYSHESEYIILYYTSVCFFAIFEYFYVMSIIMRTTLLRQIVYICMITLSPLVDVHYIRKSHSIITHPCTFFSKLTREYYFVFTWPAAVGRNWTHRPDVTSSPVTWTHSRVDGSIIFRELQSGFRKQSHLLKICPRKAKKGKKT